MRIHTRVLAGGILAAATLASTAPGAATPAPPTPVKAIGHTWDTKLTVADERSSDVALAVERHPAFGGIRVTPDHKAIEVYVTRDDPALEAAARAAAGSAALRFTRVQHSHTALRALQQRVLDDHQNGRLGATLTGAPVIDSLNRVMVEIEGLTPSTELSLLARYGAANVVVRPGRRIVPTAASRMNDFAQWNSGSFIYSPQGQGGCTAGPGVKDAAGAEYLLGAGHCFIDPDVGGTSGWSYAVHQGATFTTTDDPVRIGTAKARYPRTYETDMDISLTTLWEGGSGLSFVTTSPTATSPYSRPQKAPIRAVENTWVCFSGAYSGQRCEALVYAFDDSYPAGPGGLARISHVNRAHQAMGFPLAGPGDSGGPVYQSREDGLYVAGIIHGRQMYDNTQMACPAGFTYYDRGPNCDSVVLFTGINSAMATYGVTLNTR